MLYFIILFLLIVCIYTFDYKKYPKGKAVAYGAFCIAFILVAGLRYRIGNDSIGYEISFSKMPSLLELGSFKFSSIRYEPGYIIFSSIPKTFSSDFTYFQIFHALVLNSVVFWFVASNTQNRFLAITFYALGLYFNLNTEVLRESLAVCCFLLAWPSFKNRKWYFYYPIMFLGASFHISATITWLLPIFAIPGIRQGFRLGWRTLFICVGLFVIGFIIQRRFFSIIQLLSANETITDRANMYSKAGYGGMNLNILGMLEHSLKTIIFPLAALYYMKLKVGFDKTSKEFQKFQRYEIIVMAGVYLAVLTMTVFIIGRYNNYVGLFNYALMASCFFTVVKVKKRKFRLPTPTWVMIFLVFVALSLKSYMATVYGSSKKLYMVYYPYTSRIDPQVDPDREEMLRLMSHIK